MEQKKQGRSSVGHGSNWHALPSMQVVEGSWKFVESIRVSIRKSNMKYEEPMENSSYGRIDGEGEVLIGKTFLISIMKTHGLIMRTQ